MWSINKVRSGLYQSAKLLGHVQAASKSVREGSVKPAVKRVGRVYAGKIASRILGAMFRW